MKRVTVGSSRKTIDVDILQKIISMSYDKEKGVCFDFFDRNCAVILDEGGCDQILTRDEEDWTSSIKETLRIKDLFILETRNSLYVVHGDCLDLSFFESV